jgi:hypothetical protein
VRPVCGLAAASIFSLIFIRPSTSTGPAVGAAVAAGVALRPCLPPPLRRRPPRSRRPASLPHVPRRPSPGPRQGWHARSGCFVCLGVHAVPRYGCIGFCFFAPFARFLCVCIFILFL